MVDYIDNIAEIGSNEKQLEESTRKIIPGLQENKKNIKIMTISGTKDTETTLELDPQLSKTKAE